MKSFHQSVLAKIMPFIGIGIFLVFMLIAFVLLSYVLLFGALIGVALFVVAYIKQKFFISRNKPTATSKPKLSHVFENNEFESKK